MRDRLPPLFALQAFEAAARLASFSQAAAELKLTPGAVSRQIRQLEDWCALTLFERHGPRVSLSREGRDMLGRLGGPLSALHLAVYPQAAQIQQTLHVATLVSLARAWLLPRLADFSAQHPRIALVIETDYGLTRPPPRTAMVALRHGMRPSAELHSELLFEDRLIAVAAPALAAEFAGNELAWPSQRWLQHLPQSGVTWFAQAGYPAGFAAQGPAFNDADMVLDAAQRGLGVAVTRLSIAWPRLASGSLVLASDVCCPSVRENLVIVRKDSLELPAVVAFLDWIRLQASVWREQQEGFDRVDHPWRRAARALRKT